MENNTQTIKDIRKQNRQLNSDLEMYIDLYNSMLKEKQRIETNFGNLEAINTELKCELDSLRLKESAYTHTIENKEGQILAYRDIIESLHTKILSRVNK